MARKQDATLSVRARLLGDVCIFAMFRTGKENENDAEITMS
jgi:hypothetical protein